MNLSSLFSKKTAVERIAERDHANSDLAKVKTPQINFQQILLDFQTLDPKDPGLWPVAPKALILVGLFAALIGASWWFGWNVQIEELDGRVAEQEKLKEDWKGKKTQAVNLDEYRRQLAEIDRSFGALLKQLPNKAEMGEMLVDINKAAQSRGLLVELFKPGGEAPKDFYAEVPISLVLTGSYHDIGSFAGDIAKLPRIVTLNDINLTTGAKELLTLRTTAKTFRYLDPEEMARQKKPQKAKK